jgi:hypothetical protein
MKPRDALDFAKGCWFAPGSTLLVPQHVLQTVGPFNQELRRLEDYEWFLRFGLAGGQLIIHPEVAAVVSLGRRANLVNVTHAKHTIEDALRSPKCTQFGSEFSRAVKGYLHLEMAKAAKNERRYILMTWFLLKSLIQKPRITLALGPWWTVRATNRKI